MSPLCIVAPELMVRPTCSGLVTEIDIGNARCECNLSKRKSDNVYFIGNDAFAWAMGGPDRASRLVRSKSTRSPFERTENSKELPVS